MKIRAVVLNTGLEHSDSVVLLVLLFLEEHEIDEEQSSQKCGLHSDVLVPEIRVKMSKMV